MLGSCYRGWRRQEYRSLSHVAALMLQRTSQGYHYGSHSLLLKQVERCVSVNAKGRPRYARAEAVVEHCELSSDQRVGQWLQPLSVLIHYPAPRLSLRRHSMRIVYSTGEQDRPGTSVMAGWLSPRCKAYRAHLEARRQAKGQPTCSSLKSLHTISRQRVRPPVGW